MRLTHTVAFPGPPQTVAAALLDEGFLAAHCRLSGAVEFEVAVEGDPETGGRSRTRRVLPTDRVPDFARRLAGNALVVVETTGWWDGSSGEGRAGSVTLELEGAPVSFRADLRLAPDGEDGTVEHVDGEITAKVPLLGGRIERALLPPIQAGFDAQPRALAEWSRH